MHQFQTVDISTSASTSQIIFEALKTAIIQGNLAAGAPLKQDELAQAFNTSRIPVREALILLEQQGLVTIRRYKSAIVTGLSMNEIEEIFDFRALVETQTLTIAVPNMTEALIDEAELYLAQLNDTQEPTECSILNRKFHMTLYSASNLPYHLAVITNSINRIDRHLHNRFMLTGEMERANREHAEILAACKRKDTQVAANLMKSHILSVKSALINSFKGEINTQLKL